MRLTLYSKHFYGYTINNKIYQLCCFLFLELTLIVHAFWLMSIIQQEIQKSFSLSGNQNTGKLRVQ